MIAPDLAAGDHEHGHHERVEGDRRLDPGDRRAEVVATVAMDTFITELSSVMRNCPAARVMRTVPAPRSAPAGLLSTSPTLPSRPQTPITPRPLVVLAGGRA